MFIFRFYSCSLLFCHRRLVVVLVVASVLIFNSWGGFSLNLLQMFDSRVKPIKFDLEIKLWLNNSWTTAQQAVSMTLVSNGQILICESVERYKHEATLKWVFFSAGFFKVSSVADVVLYIAILCSSLVCPVCLLMSNTLSVMVDVLCWSKTNFIFHPLVFPVTDTIF